VTPISPEEASGELRAVYDRIAGARGGYVGNVFRALGASPATLDVVAEVGAHFRRTGRLDPITKELLVLAIAAELRNEYEWAHHWRAVTGLGVEPDAVLRHLEGSPDAGIAAVLAVARAVATRGLVDPADVASVQAHHGDEGLVEVVVMAGHYGLLAAVIEVFEVPLEPWADATPLPPER